MGSTNKRLLIDLDSGALVPFRDFFYNPWMINNTHIVFTGPSGSGKSTIIAHVLETFPSIAFSISHTTRTPRKGEIDGVSYFFVTRDRFESMIRNNELLEYVEYNGNYYGTSVSQLKEARRILLLDLEYDGVEYCRKQCPNFVIVYIHCDRNVALERLRKRMYNNPKEAEEVENRMKLYDRFASIKSFCDHVVDNTDSLEDSKRDIDKFIRERFDLQ